MKLNRMLALLVMLMMALSMFTFASAEESKTVTFPLEEPIEVTVYCCAGESSYKLEDTAIYKWMEEKTNVHLKVVNTNLTENDEKRNIALNSGDYAEVFFKSGVSPDQLLEFGKEGVFIALDDMLREYAPNYCAIIDARDDWGAVTSSDGHIYSLYEISKPMWATRLTCGSTSSGWTTWA